MEKLKLINLSENSNFLGPEQDERGFDFRSIVFENKLIKCDPFCLYKSIHGRLPKNVAYVSTPLTSAGYMQLPIGERVRANGEIAEMAISSDPDRYSNYPNFIFPHHIIPREGWQTTDYLSFWAQLLTGADPSDNRYPISIKNTKKWLEKNATLTRIINNIGDKRKTRAEAHEHFASVLIRFWVKPNAPLKALKVKEIIFVEGWEKSLGCRVEHEIAKALDEMSGIAIQYLNIPEYLRTPGPPTFVFTMHAQNSGD